MRKKTLWGIVVPGADFRFYDLSIGSTETKYIKLNTKTQIISLTTFDFCIHFQRENFFTPSVFLSPLSKCIKKSSNFHLHNKNYFGF